MSLSEERFLGLYSLNQLLLESALKARRPGGKRTDTAAAIVSGISDELDDGDGCTADAVARYTAALFLCIAELSENPSIVEAVARVNDSLHYVRVLECRQPGAVRAELKAICELCLAEQCDAAATAIADYHARRRERLPALLAALEP